MEDDGFKALLQAVGLGLHQQHLFGQAVGGFGFFGGEFGVGADGAQGGELFYAGEVGGG